MLKETIGINYKYIEIILYSPNAIFNVIFYDNIHITIILMYHTFFLIQLLNSTTLLSRLY